jgi:two-component system, OmpR family, KDP operon response regulator KdpE
MGESSLSGPRREAQLGHLSAPTHATDSRTSGKQILLVEAEAPTRRLLHTLLRSSGYEVALAASGDEALEQAARVTPDAIVLDLKLPDVNGLGLCRELREWSTTPIIVLSDDAGEQRKVEALDLGADDYVTKPFGTHELLARIRAAMRRARSEPAQPVLECGELRVDQLAHRVTVNDRQVHLTPTEYGILCYLMRHAGRVVTYPTLLRAIWGESYSDATPSLRVFVAQLRRKIEPNPDCPIYILTEPRIGYRFRSG